MRKEIVGNKWLERYIERFVEMGLSDHVLGDANYANNSYQKYGGRSSYFFHNKDFLKTSQERVVDSPVININGETYIYNNIVAYYTWEANKLFGVEINSKTPG